MLATGQMSDERSPEETIGFPSGTKRTARLLNRIGLSGIREAVTIWNSLKAKNTRPAPNQQGSYV